MKKLAALFLTVLAINFSLLGQNDSTSTDTKEKIKKGFSWGGVPAIAYDTDVGFKYGAVVNLYSYGDGSHYPDYDHSLYLEWSRTTKGNGINQLIYDSKYLIPNMRVTAEVSYFTEKNLNFYGFNGYKAYYNGNFEDKDHEDYISRMFYRHSRKLFLMKADFQGKLGESKFRWLAGISFNNNKVDSVDIDKLNEGKSGSDVLPEVPGLYDYYVDWGVISKDMAKGGNNTFLKLGLVYDSRDIEANPGKGIWDEVLLFVGPNAFGYDEFTTSALFAHRQYFTILPNTLTFAYRLAYQTKLSGNIPFYMLPYYIDSKQTKDGFGGSKTIRGILRNRVQGNGVAFGNFEFRWKAIKTYLFKQNFYIALSAFMDAGRVVDPYDIDLSNVPTNFQFERLDADGNLSSTETFSRDEWFNHNDESFHTAFGAGVHFALNQNFIIAVDYGFAAKEEDGKSGLYINLNWLF
jgi:hypothetical protein